MNCINRSDVSEDKTEAFVIYVNILAQPNPPLERLRLKGLDPQLDYKVVETGQVFGGDELMFMGLDVPELHGDFKSVVWRLKARNS